MSGEATDISKLSDAEVVDYLQNLKRKGEVYLRTKVGSQLPVKKVGRGGEPRFSMMFFPKGKVFHVKGFEPGKRGNTLVICWGESGEICPLTGSKIASHLELHSLGHRPDEDDPFDGVLDDTETKIFVSDSIENAKPDSSVFDKRKREALVPF